jgi:hypothetical protein
VHVGRGEAGGEEGWMQRVRVCMRVDGWMNGGMGRMNGGGGACSRL